MKKILCKFILSITSTIFFCYTVYAQEFTPPSPNNISLIKAFGDDIDIFSGKANLNVPLYTVREGSLAVNIALRYNGGSGLKVQEISGEAGLGWALSVGGVITRTPNNSLSNPGSALRTAADLEQTLYAGGHTELDVFNSSLGGRIIYNTDKFPYFMNEQGFKITEDGIRSDLGRWVITTPNGDNYYFGETVASRERFVSTQLNHSFLDLASAWYLSKIVSAKGEVIKFEYEKSGKVTDYQYYEMRRNQSYGVTEFNTVTNQFEKTNGEWKNNIFSKANPVEEIHLSKIITSNSTIEFLYTDREDVKNAKAISQIRILNSGKSPVTKYLFDTGYFQSADATPTLRLKLNAVRQQNTASDNTRLIALFEYAEEENLPSRTSPMIDHWGYYNNNSTGKYFLTEGADRSANLKKCRANILTAVRWSSGGTTQYTYELNTYRRSGKDHIGGGLRIGSITETDNNKVSRTTKYDYTTTSGGVKITSGLIHNLFDVTKGYVFSFWSKSNFMDGEDIKGTSENALPFQKMVDLDGITIGYSKVTKINADQSSEEYNFQDYASFPDEANFYTYTYFSGRGTNRSVTDLIKVAGTDQYNGLSTVTSNSMKRGLLKSKIIRNDKKEVLKSISYKYKFVMGTELTGFSREITGTYTNKKLERTIFYTGSLYNERVTTVQLEEVTEENRYPATGSTIHTTTTTNEYRDQIYPFQLIRQRQKQSDGSQRVVTYKYQHDMFFAAKDPDGIYLTMGIKNMINPVIERIETINGKQTQLTRTNYGSFHFDSFQGPFLPKSVEVQNDDFPIETTIVYESYNMNGNPTAIKKLSQPSVVTLWGYGGLFPVLEIKNATYIDVRDILGEYTINKLNAVSVTDDEIKNAETFLRSRFPEALITSYRYNPLTGMTSKTDERGRNESYKYDDFGRLSAVLDDSEDVVQSFTYNIPQLPENARIISLAYTPKIEGSGENLCASSDRKQYYVTTTEKNGRAPIVVGTVLYNLDGSLAARGYYSRGSGLAYIDTSNGRVTNIYNCWDQFHEIEW